MARKVLLVDDDDNHILLSTLLLQRLGYDAVACSDGIEAEEVFRADSDAFYFVATDYTMNRIDGLELARRLLAINPRVAILLLTGYDHPEIIRVAREIGIRSVSLKPISADEFDEIIRGMGL